MARDTCPCIQLQISFARSEFRGHANSCSIQKCHTLGELRSYLATRHSATSPQPAEFQGRWKSKKKMKQNWSWYSTDVMELDEVGWIWTKYGFDLPQFKMPCLGCNNGLAGFDHSYIGCGFLHVLVRLSSAERRGHLWTSTKIKTRRLPRDQGFIVHNSKNHSSCQSCRRVVANCSKL